MIEALRQQFHAAVAAAYQPNTVVYFRHNKNQEFGTLAHVHNVNEHRVTVHYHDKRGRLKYKQADYRRFQNYEDYTKDTFL
jgi:major membrane immunogen (membrane-anchored lipoprotein)